MFNIRDNIKVALAVLGITPYRFCKENGVELSNFSAFLNGGNTLGVAKIQAIMTRLGELLAKMPRFKVTVKFANGSICNAYISAPTAEEAVNRVVVQPDFALFGGGDIVSTHVTEYCTNYSAQNYVLQPSKDAGWYILTDTAKQIVIKFKKGDFDNTQKATILFDKGIYTAAELAAATEEMRHYLMEHHKDIF